MKGKNKNKKEREKSKKERKNPPSRIAEQLFVIAKKDFVGRKKSLEDCFSNEFFVNANKRFQRERRL